MGGIHYKSHARERNEMTDTEHTPGPWEVVETLECTPVEGHDEHGIPDLLILSEVNCRQIAETHRIYNGGERDTTMEQANAALIASAPTLRAERDELVGFIEDEAQLIAYDDDTTHDELCIMVDQFRHKASALLKRIT